MAWAGVRDSDSISDSVLDSVSDSDWFIYVNWWDTKNMWVGRLGVFKNVSRLIGRGKM